MKRLIAMLGLAAFAGACADGPTAAAPELHRSGAPGVVGAVYTMSNAAGGNAILVFHRTVNGDLVAAGQVATGGAGTGAGLGNQSGLVISDDGQELVAVNAGDNTISSLVVTAGIPRLVSRISSGGSRPISLALRGRTLYVLNAGGQGNITGFHLTPDGALVPIANSTQPLSGAANPGPAQVGFSPDGGLLVVTEKATSQIVTYLVGSDGRAGGPRVRPSSGSTPFGFGFTNRGQLLVSEAAGGVAGGGALSSYAPQADGSLTVVSGSVATLQGAACWVGITNDGRFAFTTNTPSGTISGFLVSAGGDLQLRDADGVTADAGAGSGPIDLALSRDSRFVYTLNGGTGEIAGFRVTPTGGLEQVGAFGALPPGANGLAAR